MELESTGFDSGYISHESFNEIVDSLEERHTVSMMKI